MKFLNAAHEVSAQALASFVIALTSLGTGAAFALPELESCDRQLSALNWYAESAPLPPLGAIYYEIARSFGGRVVVGGSDLFDILLGGGQKVASSEMNVLIQQGKWNKLSELIKSGASPSARLDFLGPAAQLQWSSVHLVNSSVILHLGVHSKFQSGPPGFMEINIGELNWELAGAMNFAAQGKSVVERFAAVAIPFKNDFLIEVLSEGPARVYFRTKESRHLYERKVLALPDERMLASSNWHQRQSPRILEHVIQYNIIVVTRGIKAGWTISPASREVLAKWIRAWERSSGSSFMGLVPEKNSYRWSLQGLEHGDFVRMVEWILE